MNSLGMIQVPQMAQSSHGIYPVSNNAGTPLVIDENANVAVDNTMQALLNQSQLTGSGDGTPVGMVVYDNTNNPTGPSSVGGHFQGQPTSTG